MIYFFLLNLIIIYSNKKNCPTYGFNPTQPNPCGLGWVGLDLCDGLDWVGLNFFFLPTMMGWVKKSPQPDPTRPMHTSSLGKQFHNKKLDKKLLMVGKKLCQQ